MPYCDYLIDFSKRFATRFDEIAAHHNVVLGPEFEIAVCETIRLVLPSRFGVCRGFVVNNADEKAGDDVIIFDRERFPTLRLLPQNDFSRLEDVPVEAVCAYLEAKHTLYINPTKAQVRKGEGPNLYKALEQVKKVKGVSRDKLPLGFFTQFTRAKKGHVLHLSEHDPQMPDHLNPILGAVISRFVRISEDEDREPSCKEIAESMMNSHELGAAELVIAGPNILALPIIPAKGNEPAILASPFFVQGQSELVFNRIDAIAWGVGVALLLEALKLIQLGDVAWNAVALDALNKSATDKYGCS